MELIKKYLERHKVSNFLDQTKRVRNYLNLIDEDLWKNLNSKKFNLIYVRETKEFVVIFRHLDKDEIDESDYHTFKCIDGKRQPIKKKKANQKKFVTEEIVEFFSTVPLPQNFQKKVQEKYSSVYFEFYSVNNAKATMSPEKEILFIILMRLYNFDLHFEEIAYDLQTTNKKDRQSFVK